MADCCLRTMRQRAVRSDNLCFAMTACSRALAADSGEGAILPTWTSVDNLNVRTSRELWGQMKEEGWNVDVRHLYSGLQNPLTSLGSIIGMLCSLLHSILRPSISGFLSRPTDRSRYIVPLLFRHCLICFLSRITTSMRISALSAQPTR